ncbi:MAG: YegS/Rv2252/BmrU family lipid kinase [Agathobacter sp.]|nr:YegS/Rv2252/BmrU family lipid kinase [Agathobacter sp.]
MSEKKLLFVFNPKSGMGLIKNHLLDIVDIMVKAGYDPTVYPTQARGDATRKVKEDGANYDRIVCSGGDGTLDEVVTGLREADLHIPLGYIPAGSTNDFARTLGISNDMVKAAEIAAGEHIFPCDVGQFNDDTFIYIAGFGLFTEISYDTPQELKNVLGHAAYILSAAKSLASIPNYLMQIEANGEVIQDRFIYGMITNSLSVGGFKGITGKDVQLDDGEFEVTLIKSPNNPIELNEIVGYLTGILHETKMVYSFKTDHIQVRSRASVAWTIDGENGGEHWNVDIRNHHRVLNILTKEEA